MHRTTGNRTFFYKKLSVGAQANGSFPSQAQIKFPFQATHVIISNDSDQTDLTFSFNTPDIDGELFKKEQPVTFDGISVGKLWFFKETDKPNAQVRVWAWRK